MPVLEGTCFNTDKLLFCETAVGRAYIARHLESHVVIESHVDSVMQLKQLSKTAQIFWVNNNNNEESIDSVGKIDFPVEKIQSVKEVDLFQRIVSIR